MSTRAGLRQRSVLEVLHVCWEEVKLVKTTTVRLDSDLAASLELIAQVEGRSVADEIREAVALLVEDRLSQDKKFFERAERAIEEELRTRKERLEVYRRTFGSTASENRRRAAKERAIA